MRDDFSVIYSGNIVQADLLKCLLEGAGIAALLEDEFFGMYAPGNVKVLIANGDVHKAHRMVESFVKSSTLKVV
jgi:hypothetical protein